VRFKSIELENIRSYEGNYKANTIEFPEGSILLAGDIGSGKSSILLAMEFALFGISRGELSGEALLRRGKRTGGVRLDFTAAGKDINIERRLTRTPLGVRQESGYMIMDGVKREGTAQELKAWILNILGYPQELVQRQKSLIYRYTVYTPQERMKQIIRAEKETRLETLRKVFGVDRYKTVKDNITLFLSSLRAKRRELKTRYRELEDKREEKKKRKRNIAEVEKTLKSLGGREKRAESRLSKWKKKREEIEEEIEQYIKYDKELSKEKEKHRGISLQIEDVKNAAEEKKKAVESLRRLRKPTDETEEEIQKRIDMIQLEIERHLKDPRSAGAEFDSLFADRDRLQEESKKDRENWVSLKTKIESLEESTQKLEVAGDICPICGKQLDEEHKTKKLKEYREEIAQHNEERRRLEEHEKTLRSESERVEQLIRDKVRNAVEELKARKENPERTLNALREYERQMERKQDIESQIEEQDAKLEELRKTREETEERIASLKERIEELRDVEERRRRIEASTEELNTELKGIMAEISREETSKEYLLERITELEKEIEAMTKAKDFEENLSAYESWIEGYLMNLADTVEKHYMIEIRRQFEPLFQDWFSLLMEDEDLSVKIDQEFTPIIEQQGYEAEFENLSGGESTSVALAYRLALNKVINTMAEGIQTKDIIVLDEPTDGFSENQLDKIGEVIDQLGIPQTIIVSHEPKIESYVDNILYVDKEEGFSKIRSKAT